MSHILRIMAGLSGLLFWTVQAQGEADAVPLQAPSLPVRPAEFPLLELPAPPAVSPAPAPAAPSPAAEAEEVDVVDAHWMALTMWGEARAHGEIGMRAVGHVIHNRKLGGDAFVTDTVSKAYQFSCWNEGDPNREAMLNIASLRLGSADAESWSIAKRVAQEILAGRSTDITGGAKFYHTTGVSPAWSRGLEPDRVIGNHLFFRSVQGSA